MMIWISLVLTSVIVVTALRLWPRVDSSLGCMSQQWLIECHASHRTTSA
jgi:hypothetical protein